MVVIPSLLLIFSFLLTCSYQHFTPNTQKYERLEKWGMENGLLKRKIELKFFSKYEKYYIATEDIEQGEKVLSIPKKLFFDRTLPKSKKLKFLEDKILNTNGTLFYSDLSKEQIFNTVHLIKLLKNRKSKVSKFLEPYFDSFPTDLSNFPILYEPEELRLIRNTFFADIVRYSKETMNEEVKFLRNNFNFTLNIEEYTFYRVMLVANSFNILGINVLVPFTDLFKHHTRDHNMKWEFIKEEEMLVFEATKPIKKGEIIVMANREASNHQLLFFYGYTEENNYLLNEFKVDILHPYFRHQKNFTRRFSKHRMDILNDTCIEENIDVYNEICEYYDYNSGDKLRGYKLMLESLNYYDEDNENVKESDYFTILVSERNRENIKRIIELEKIFVKYRIETLKKRIKELEESHVNNEIDKDNEFDNKEKEIDTSEEKTKPDEIQIVDEEKIENANQFVEEVKKDDL